jgi:hypothetical protein
MKALFLVIIIILAVAVGAQVYKNYATPVVPYVQPQENNNQERPPLSFEGDVFPTELKTDPATGDKIFEGLGVRFRVPGEFSAYVWTVTPGKIESVIVQTPEDEKRAKEILTQTNLSGKGFGPPATGVSFELNEEHLTLDDRIRRGGLRKDQYDLINIAGVDAVRFESRSAGGPVVYFVTPNMRYIVTIGIGYEESYGYGNIVQYQKAFDYILSTLEFTQ